MAVPTVDNKKISVNLSSQIGRGCHSMIKSEIYTLFES